MMGILRCEDYTYTLYGTDSLPNDYFTVFNSNSKEAIDREYCRCIKTNPTWHFKVIQKLKIKQYTPKDMQ